jgi:hypothetical protein
LDRADKLLSILTAIALIGATAISTALILTPDESLVPRLGDSISIGLVFLDAGFFTYAVYKKWLPLEDAISSRSNHGAQLPSRLTGKDAEYLGTRLDNLAGSKNTRDRQNIVTDIASIVGKPQPRFWRRGVRRVIFRTLDYFGREWDHFTFEQKEKILFAFAITARNDNKALKHAKETFYAIAESTYNLPELEQNPVRFAGLGVASLRLSQEFNGHDEDYEIRLADDAIKNWGPEKFRNLWAAIELGKVRSKDGRASLRLRAHFEQMRSDYEARGDVNRAGNAAAFLANIGEAR